MQYVNLGKTGMKVSRLCLGMMSYGSKKWREWVLEEEESKPFIKRALDAIGRERVLGAVLNQAAGLPAGSYGYYEYYGSSTDAAPARSCAKLAVNQITQSQI